MAKYREKPVVIEAITFDELVQHGRDSNPDDTHEMPWHFEYKGHPITLENNKCYLIPTAEGLRPFTPEYMLIVSKDGEICPYRINLFAKKYEKVEEAFNPRDGKLVLQLQKGDA